MRKTVLLYFEDYGEEIDGSMLHCGSGPDSLKYGQYFPNAKRYRCLNRWDGLGGGRFPNVDIHADVQNMPECPSDSEDCIIATFLLYQVRDVDAVAPTSRKQEHGNMGKKQI